jgi:hypothetical protein
VILHDLLNHRKTEAGPPVLATAHERLEDGIPNRFRNAAAVVLDPVSIPSLDKLVAGNAIMPENEARWQCNQSRSQGSLGSGRQGSGSPLRVL